MLFKYKISTSVILIILLKFSFFLIFLTSWLKNFFGDYVAYQEILFYLSTGISFIKNAPQDVIYSFLVNVFLKSLIATLMILFFYFCFKRYKNLIYNKLRKIDLFNQNVRSTFIIIFFFSTIIYFSINFDFQKLFLNKINKEIFYIKNYKNPKDLEYKKPNTFKNLILIFFESAEKDLPNFSIKVENDKGSIEEYIDNEYIYEPIKEFNNYEIENFVQAESLGWSMAGMAAAQCGIPIYNLNRSFKEKNILSNNKKSTCIGDILKDFGYKQFFFTGGSKNFQQMDKFFLNHGYDNVFGKSYYITQGIDNKYFRSWGGSMFDDILFNQVIERLKKVKKDQDPFNVTIITSDTHVPFEFMSPNCHNNDGSFNKIFKNHFYLNMRESFKCTSKFISKFINELKKENLFDNTLVVIAGDHLIPISKQTKQYLKIRNTNNNPLANRRIFFTVINSKNNPTRNLMSHYDIGPTILNDLKLLDLDQDKFGLGLSLYSKYKPDRYFKEYNKIISTENLGNIFNEIYE